LQREVRGGFSNLLYALRGNVSVCQHDRRESRGGPRNQIRELLLRHTCASIGKLQLYTACAGAPPDCVLPVLFDIGTTNARLSLAQRGMAAFQVGGRFAEIGVRGQGFGNEAIELGVVVQPSPMQRQGRACERRIVGFNERRPGPRHY
jgi:Malic enzyme, N-terminal domain